MTLEQRSFASTGRKTSLLGLGTVKFGRNLGVKYPGGDGFALPTDSEICSLLDLALENGITLLDTAPAYGTSEERLGRLLGARRDKFFLSTKTGEEFRDGKSEYIFTKEHTLTSVERSLKRLKTDRLDCVLVHCNRDDVRVLTQTPVLETLSRLKEEGKILSFGASTYTVEAGLYAAERADCVMVTHNMGYTDEKPVIDEALKRGKAILVKKGLASGHVDSLNTDPATAIKFVLDTPGVTSLVIGSITPKNILANIEAAKAAKKSA